MAIHFTDKEQNQIRLWLLELRKIVTPEDFVAHRDRARELVGRLDRYPCVPTSTIADEFGRVRRIWRRLEAQADNKNRTDPHSQSTEEF
jgi:hypothetical protein